MNDKDGRVGQVVEILFRWDLHIRFSVEIDRFSDGRALGNQ